MPAGTEPLATQRETQYQLLQNYQLYLKLEKRCEGRRHEIKGESWERAGEQNVGNWDIGNENIFRITVKWGKTDFTSKFKVKLRFLYKFFLKHLMPMKCVLKMAKMKKNG